MFNIAARVETVVGDLCGKLIVQRQSKGKIAMTWQRRELMMTLAAGVGAFAVAGRSVAAPRAQSGRSPFAPGSGPRKRVLFINDLSGDVDGLFATVHALLSPSIDLRGIIGTTTGTPRETTAMSVLLGEEMVRLTGRAGKVPVFAGAQGKLKAANQPMTSAGTQAIIDEAMRTDTELPLYVAVGGGLTEVASALLIEPAIADRMTLVWIGGTISSETISREYNFGIDPLAAQFVFNQSTVPLWQVPAEAYGACLVSTTELQARVAPAGKVGRWLYDKLLDAEARLAGFRINTGETYTLGDNPLVLLTALTDWPPTRLGKQPIYENTSSSPFKDEAAPMLDQKGHPQPRQEGRRIRIYRDLDTRMMLEDFFAKLAVSQDK